jgi:gliding motility-associated-like protein
MSNAIHMKRTLFNIILALMSFGLNAQLQVSVSVTLPTCYGSTDGEATATASGGASPYKYTWSNGQMGQTITGLKAGEYCVSVTDAAAKTAIKNFTVSQLDPITISTTLGSPCGNSFTCNSYVSGGKKPYTYTWRNLDNGQIFTTANLTNPPQGNYRLDVKDVYGCSASKTLSIFDNFTVSVKTVDIKCYGVAGGSAEVSTTGGTAPFTYKWSNGATAKSISPIAAGIYTVTVTDANGCVKMDVGKVREPERLRINESVLGGCSNATGKVAPTGGTAPYTVKWSNGATGTSATGLTAGTYGVTVTDANGCVENTNLTVRTEGVGIAVSFTKSDASCSDFKNGNATALPTGTGPFTYNWSNGATTQTASNLAAGTYKVTVTNAAGCSAQSEVAIGNSKNLVATVSSANTAANGSTGTATVTTITGGTSPYTFKWSNGQTTQTAKGLAEGMYSVTITDAEGCQITVTGIVVKSNPNPIISVVLAKIDASCSGVVNGSITSTPTGTAPFTYKWSNGATTKDLTNLPNGTYVLTLTDAAGLITTSQVTINNSRNLGLTTGTSNSACGSNSGSAFVSNVLDGVGPFTYKWSNGQTTQTASNLGSGAYSVTVTDAQGCSVVGNNIVVNSVTNLSTSFTVTDESCAGKDGEIVFNTTGGTAPYTYKWSDNQSTQTASGLSGGTYTVTVTDAKGCSVTSNGIVVKAGGSPISLTTTKANATCSGFNNGSIQVTPTGAGPFTYKWSNGSTNQINTNLGAGTYSVTVTNASGCTAQTEVVVGNIKNLAATFSSANTNFNGANGTATVTTITGGYAPYTYKWNNGQTTQTATGLAEGTYSVTITDAEGCQIVLTGISVKSNPNIAVLLAKTDASCSGIANGSVTASPTGTAPFTYKWSNGATSKDLVNVPNGTYVLTLSDAAGLTKTSQVTINNSRNLGLTTGSSNSECSNNSGTAFVSNVLDGVGPFTYKWSNGATTQSASNVGAGSYSVTVTDAQGCSVVGSNIVVNSVSTLSTTFTATDETCGGKNGRINFNTTGGTAPYTYKWADNQTTQNATGLSAGTYTVTVTDAKGCSVVSNSIVVGISGSPISITTTKANATCNGLSNGSVSATPTGAGPFTYNWSNGATTQTISNVPAGTYKVTVSNASGCSTQAEAVVGNIKNIAANITSANTNFNSSTGSATVTTVTGGTAPYTYKWSNGQTTQTATGLAEGTYSVTITDAEGCQIVLTGISVKSNPSISILLAKTDASCNGVANGSATATPTGTSPFTYKWSNGATTKDLTNLQNGTYVLTLTDAAGLTTTSQVTINNSRTLSLVTGTTNTDCSTNTGTGFVTTVVDGVGPYTYKWSNDATTQTAGNLGAGTYKVTVTDAQGCSVVGSNINVNSNAPNITSTITVTDENCTNKNGKIAFNTTGGTAPYTYKWSGGTNTDNLAAGDYTFTITDANKCTAIEKVSVKTKGGVKAAFSAAPIYNTADPNMCNSDSVSTKLTSAATGSIAGATYKWSYPTNKTSTEASPTVKLGAGTSAVQLTVTSPDGCIDSIKLNIVSISPRINVDVQDSALTCQGVSYLVSFKNNNPGFPMTYKWSPDSLIAAGGTLGTPSVLVKGAGVNKVYVTITNSVGCSKIDSVLLNTIPLDAVKLSDIGFKQNCNNNAVSFTNKSSYADKYSWKFGDTANPNAGSNESNPMYMYAQGGTYQVILVPKTGCLDTLKLNVPVRANAPVSVVAKDTVVCDSMLLSVKATSSLTNPKYEWSINPNFTPVFNTTNTVNIKPVNPTNTYYVRATDSLGCVGVDTVVIGNRGLKVIVDTLINACKSLDKKISINSANAADVITVIWSPASAIVGANGGKDVTIKTTTDFTLGALATNQFGCSQTVSIPVKAREVDATAAVDAKLVLLDDKVTLSAGPTGTGYTYQWTPSTDAVDPKSATTKASPKQDTKYVVEVTDVYGCRDTASVTVTVLTAQCSEPYVFVPRAFSPNNDGLNEKVFVRGEYLLEESFEFAIYNRWGERVFFTNSREVGWDGTSGSKGVCPDVYGYYVKGKCRKGETYFKKGNITVMK